MIAINCFACFTFAPKQRQRFYDYMRRYILWLQRCFGALACETVFPFSFQNAPATWHLCSPAYTSAPLLHPPHGPQLLGASLQHLSHAPLDAAQGSQQRRQRVCGTPHCHAVTRLAHSPRPQIFICACAAVFSATFFLLDYRLLRWRLSGKDVHGDRVWNHLRRFSGWMFGGSAAGIVTFALFLKWRDFEYESTDLSLPRRQFYQLQASLHRCFTSFNVFYPLYSLCIVYSMTTLLRRVSDHASHSYYSSLRDCVDVGRSSSRSNNRFDWRDCIGQYALYYWVRTMHVIAMILCALHALARAVSAGFTAKVAGLYDIAADETDADGAETVNSLVTWKAITGLVEGHYLTSIAASRVIESTVLLFVASGFLLFFPAIIVMFNRVERKMDALLREMCLRTDVGTAFLPFEFLPRAADGSVSQTEMPIAEVRQYMRDIKSCATAQRRRFVFCLVLMIAALLALTSNAVFVAASFVNSTRSPVCGRCDLCQSLQFLMMSWLVFTPELFPLLSSLSSTLPLMFSLWLMTTPEDRALLMHPHRFLAQNTHMNTVETLRGPMLRAERIRMGIDLQ
jgi:hypothetical protein